MSLEKFNPELEQAKPNKLEKDKLKNFTWSKIEKKQESKEIFDDPVKRIMEINKLFNTINTIPVKEDDMHKQYIIEFLWGKIKFDNIDNEIFMYEFTDDFGITTRISYDKDIGTFASKYRIISEWPVEYIEENHNNPKKFDEFSKLIEQKISEYKDSQK